MAVAAIDGENGDRSPRSPRASDAASAWTQATDNVRTIARTLDRFEGWHASKFRTCSDAISVRTLSKSVPGTATPHSVTRQLVLDDRSVPFLSMGNGNGSHQWLMSWFNVNGGTGVARSGRRRTEQVRSIWRLGANPERERQGGIVPPPFGLGPWVCARVVSPRSPTLRPGHHSS